MKKLLFVLSLTLVTTKVHAAYNPWSVAVAPSVTISSTSAAAAGALVTITTAPNSGPFSTGLNTYLSHIHIEYYATGTLTGGATPVVCTTTNLPGNPSFKFPTAEATGVELIEDMDFSNPIQTTSPGNITISCPGTASTLWNIVATYFYQQQ